MRATEPPANDSTLPGPIIQRCYCASCWRAFGERTIVIHKALVTAECCGWSLPPRLVRIANGFAEPTAHGRLEASRQLGTVPDEAHSRDDFHGE